MYFRSFFGYLLGFLFIDSVFLCDFICLPLTFHTQILLGLWFSFRPAINLNQCKSTKNLQGYIRWWWWWRGKNEIVLKGGWGQAEKGGWCQAENGRDQAEKGDWGQAEEGRGCQWGILWWLWNRVLRRSWSCEEQNSFYSFKTACRNYEAWWRKQNDYATSRKARFGEN